MPHMDERSTEPHTGDWEEPKVLLRRIPHLRLDVVVLRGQENPRGIRNRHLPSTSSAVQDLEQHATVAVEVATHITTHFPHFSIGSKR